MSLTSKEIAACYKNILGRLPSETELDDYKKSVDGLTMEKLHQKFFDSEEFKRLHPKIKGFSFFDESGNVTDLLLYEEPAKFSLGSDEWKKQCYAGFRNGQQYILVVDTEDKFAKKIVSHSSFRKGLSGGEADISCPYFLTVRRDDSWRSDMSRIWQEWKKSTHDFPCIPVVREGKPVAVIVPFIWPEKRYADENKNEPAYDIDIELFRLIQNHNIYEEQPDLQEIYYDNYMTVLLNEMMDSIPVWEKVAFVGGDDSTKEILSRLSDRNRNRVAFIVDDNLDHNVEEIPAVKPGDIDRFKIKVVVATSYNQREYYKCKLIPDIKNGKIRVIDAYDYLSQRRVTTGRSPFEKPNKYRHITYMEVNNALTFYNHAEPSEKAFYLKRLIAYLVEIKNFPYAEKYMKVYIENRWSGYERYLAFMTDFSGLVEEIKSKVNQREQADIILNWVDNTNAEQFYNTKFMKKMKGHACFFTNAFTNAAVTHLATFTIFTGKLPIEERGWEQPNFDESNSPLLKCLKEHGYIFKYDANPGLYFNQFPSESQIGLPNGFRDVLIGRREVSETSSRLQWIGLRTILLSKDSVCILIHNLTEPHEPYATIERFDVRFAKNQRECQMQGLELMSDILDFYSQFIGSSQHVLWFNDHGNVYTYNRDYYDGLHHIGMVVKSPKIVQTSFDEMYQHINLYKIIEQLLSSSSTVDWQAISSNHVIYECLDWMNGVDDMIFYWKRDKTVNLKVFQSASVRTKEDLYVRYPAGKELYFREPDESTNLIEKPEYRERVNYLRSLAPKKFVDIYKEEAFKNSRRMYEYLATIPEDKIPW